MEGIYECDMCGKRCDKPEWKTITIPGRKGGNGMDVTVVDPFCPECGWLCYLTRTEA